MGQYIWQRKKWPSFTWDSEALLGPVAAARRIQGEVIAKADFVGLDAQADVLVEEAFTTSAIEGESLDRKTIRSSVARRLGLPSAGLPPTERHIDGLVEVLLDATTNYQDSLTQKRIFGWHAALFPTGYSGMKKISVGKWRDHLEPMQVISGPVGKERVHFEAPPSENVKSEMNAFLDWWKNSTQEVDGIIRAGVAHLWFVTIHPFEDGNGRLARVLTDMALAQDEKTGRRLYSLSSQIMNQRESYYLILEKTQKQSTDITGWLEWFLNMFVDALKASQKTVDVALDIAKFWQHHSQSELNERQVKVIKKLLEAGPDGFKGGLTNRKYVSMTRASRETAKRDLSDLEKKGILKRLPGKGRSVSYKLVT